MRRSVTTTSAGCRGELLQRRGAAVGDLGVEARRLQIVGDRSRAMSTTSSTTSTRSLRPAAVMPAPRRAAAAAGHSTVAVVPAPACCRDRSAPPWLRTMLAAIGSPSPVPSPRGLVVKNGSNTACRCSGAMPEPLIDDPDAHHPAVGRARLEPDVPARLRRRRTR